ncbi:MAG: hypothetical protein HOP08_00730 [Cyclobacteriaceae bacterium]|nr:hypothetical protein [Cyclobacteriaceae bacterium]
MELFDNKRDRQELYSKHLENPYDFFDSAIGIFQDVRELLNSWFINYPLDEQAELKSRFQSDFYPAFFELTLHEIFRRQGYTLLVHPAVSGTGKRPDFLISKDDIKFYLEARVVTDVTAAEQARMNKRDLFYDQMARIKNKKFGISLHSVEFISGHQPNGKKAVKFFDDYLSKLDHASLIEQVRIEHNYHIPEQFYEDKDVRIVFVPWPLDVIDESIHQPILSYPHEGWMGGCEESIKKAIKVKSTGYGNMEYPYLICLNCISKKRVDNTDIVKSLYHYYDIDQALGELERERRLKEQGIFSKAFAGSFEKVSGVFITNVAPTTLHVAPHWLCNNPNARHSLCLSDWRLDKNWWEGNEFRTRKGITLGQVVDLPVDWLQ